jgi:glucokinase
MSMILAGDVGGTKTLLGLFDPTTARPAPLAVRAFETLAYRDLLAMISDFTTDPAIRGAAIGSACFGVAGPVIAETAELTNVPWRVDARAVGTAFGMARVALLNDLQAMAYAVPVLQESELHTLQGGKALAGGNLALIAAGTGLGESLLHNVGGRFIPSPCEGGHADFPARNEREIVLLRDLIRRFGRASVEHVVSGPGLLNVHRVTHNGACLSGANPLTPAAISEAALERRCRGCLDALEMFVAAYGSEAGNLALRSVATGGLFIGGGIAPKILPALVDGRFMTAFRDKHPFRDMLSAMPVKIIVNADAGLLGAAVFGANG